MTDWAAWGPTIVTLVSLVFFGGIGWGQLKDHGTRLDSHDKQHEETEKRDTLQDIAIAKLQSFNEGFSTARNIYDKSNHQIS